MKIRIKKLLCSSLVVFMSIGMHFIVEARVTREVAEATLPYLMEAVGIPQAQRTPAHINALISMIYTDAGQREMVDWTQNEVFPPTPAGAGFVAANTYTLATGTLDTLQKLFPCGPGTFSSYATHSSRLGYNLLNNAGHLINICNCLILGNIATLNVAKTNRMGKRHIRDIINLFPSSNVRSIDTKLAIVLFILDICDTADQIFNILDVRHATTPITGYTLPTNGANGTRNIHIAIVYNEYNHRPVSATAANGQGDCVQTLYRHLVNIAIQNNGITSRRFNAGHLPVQLRGYYTTRYGAINQGIITVPVTETEAGLTQLMHHQSWHDALVATVPAGTDITNGAIDNIVRVLGAIRPLNMSTLNAIARVYNAPLLNPAIPTSIGIGGAGTNQQANAIAIQDALNALDGRCAAGNERFIVTVTDHMVAPQIIAIQNQLPTNTDLVIQIADRLWNRTITIGARAAGTVNAHAEIVSIN